MEQGKIVQFSQIRNQKINKPKKRLKKKIKSFFFSLFIIAIVGLVLYFASPISRLSVIYFDGINYVKRSELLELSQLNYDRLFLSLDLSNVQEKIQSHPLIQQVKVKRKGLNSLSIQVIEKDIIGCAQLNPTPQFILNDGTIVEDSPGLNAKCDGFVIYGLPNSEDSQSILKLFVKSLMNLDPIFLNIIKEIHYEPLYGDNNRFSLFLSDGNTVNINSYSMVHKLNYYQTMAEKVQSLYGDIKGIYHLDVGDHFEPYDEMSKNVQKDR